MAGDGGAGVKAASSIARRGQAGPYLDRPATTGGRLLARVAGAASARPSATLNARDPLGRLRQRRHSLNLRLGDCFAWGVLARSAPCLPAASIRVVEGRAFLPCL